MMQRPIILKQDEIEQYKASHKIWQQVDLIKEQLGELYEINFPAAHNDKAKRETFIEDNISTVDQYWIYYPWSGVLLRTIGEPELFRLRTNRNQNLITKDELQKCNKACIGIFGLSVGNSIAVTLAYSGVDGLLKLGDFDTISTSNLNRLRAGLKDVGKPKVDLVAEQIWELNPFAELELYEHGIHEGDLDAFFGGTKPQVIFDEIDDFQMKIKLRIKAKKEGVSVVMLTSLGDNVLIDVERFDLDKNIALFNGLLGNTPEEILNSEIGEREKVKYAINLVGSKYIPAKALESLFEINRTLVGRPQLGSTIMIGGGIGTFIARKIILGQSLPSGRYYLSLENLFGIVRNDSADQKAAVEKLDKMLGES